MRDPVENADDYKSKLTFGVYFTKDSQAYDLNLRHQFGPSVTAWIAGYADSTGSELLRIGGSAMLGLMLPVLAAAVALAR